MNRPRILRLTALIAATFLFCGQAYALVDDSGQYQQKQTQKSQPNEAQLVEHGSYVNKAGNMVHSPAHTKDGSIPQGASAKCSDGTFSFSQSRRGTCSRHGGVSQWL